jgi:hypothetical protein
MKKLLRERKKKKKYIKEKERKRMGNSILTYKRTKTPHTLN